MKPIPAEHVIADRRPLPESPRYTMMSEMSLYIERGKYMKIPHECSIGWVFPTFKDKA